MRWTDEDWWVEEAERDRRQEKRVLRIGTVLLVAFTIGALAPWHLLPWNQ